MQGSWWLVIEDDDVDVMSIERGLRQLGQEVTLAVVPNGLEPIAHLRACRAEQGGRAPDLIVVDINLPLASGHDVLRQLRDHPEGRALPRIVLSTSDHASDVAAAYEAGAAGYFVKPVDFPSFVKTLSTIVDYWASARRA